MIELLPPDDEVVLSGDDVNFILVQIELQGGDRRYVHYINKRIEEIIGRNHDGKNHKT